MASFTLTFPDNVQTRVVNGLAGHYGYEAKIDGVDNPEGKAAFALRKLKEELKLKVIQQEAQEAAEASRISTLNTSDSEIDIT